MNYFDIFLFTMKYIPFWAVPSALICAHFAYLYWLKDYREIAYVWVAGTLFCLTMVILYLVLGGPSGIAKIFTKNF